jgi:cell division protein FtsI/penicillin-binding protein 2
VVRALEVSCNYFFCESAYRMGNVHNSTTLQGIQTLNDYMMYFGLNDKTGVEVGELFNAYDNSPLTYRISSPEFKKYVELSRDPFAHRTEWDWYDGDTVRTAIGQSKNAYTTAMMARYTMIIANRGQRYPLRLVHSIEEHTGGLVMDYQPVPEPSELDISSRTWDALFEGMVRVTETSLGTASQYYRDYPIRVAGKTGTAQHGSTVRPDHSNFAAFAPYDDPMIAVYVNIPFGSSPRYYSHVSARIAREMISETLGLQNGIQYPDEVNSLRR